MPHACSGPIARAIVASLSFAILIPLQGCGGDSQAVPDESAKVAPVKSLAPPPTASKQRGRAVPKSIKDRG